jgi:hypothetical protein
MKLVTRLFDLAAWALRNPRVALEVTLVALVAFYGWRYHKKAAQLDMAQVQAEGLEKDLKQKITIANNEIEILKRENGVTTVRRIYVPPEGSVVIRKKDQEAQQRKLAEILDSLKAASLDKDALARRIQELMGHKEGDGAEEIIVKNKGLTFRPGFGMDYTGVGLQPRLDFKFAYWDRWGAIAGGSYNGIGLGVSRRLDDIIWRKMQNLEAFLGYNFITFDGRKGKSGVAGLRVNF